MFLALAPTFDPSYASLGKLENASDDVPLSKLRRGQLVGVDLGRKARFARSKEPFRFGPSGKSTPAGTTVVDLFRTRQTGCFVVSPRLRTSATRIDSSLRPSRVGLTGVDGLDHGFVLTAPLVDALDLAASKAKVGKFDGTPDEITRAKSLVLRPAAVPPDRAVFRVPLLDGVWFVRQNVRPQLAGFTGLELSDPETTAVGE